MAHLCDTGGKTLATVERAARARASEPARRPLGVPMELLYLMSRLTIIFSLVVELFWWYSVTYQILADGISSSYYKWKLSWYHLPWIKIAKFVRFNYGLDFKKAKMPWNDKYIILNLQIQIGYIKRKQTNKNIHVSLYSGSRGGSRIFLKRRRTPLRVTKEWRNWRKQIL